MTLFNDLRRIFAGSDPAVMQELADAVGGAASDAGTLTGTTLAANVVSSSLTGLGTVATGVWQATPVAAAYVGALPASKVTSGLFAVGRIATGTPDGTKFLRDDQVWAAPPAGGSGLPTDGSGVMTGPVVSTIGTVAANTPALTATQTWNSGGVTFQGIYLNVTPTAAAAASTLLDLLISGSSKFSVDKDGNTQSSQLNVGGVANSIGVISLGGNSILDVTGYPGTGLRINRGGWNDVIISAGSFGVGAATDASAIMGATSTTKGFLPPRMTTTQRDAISSPAAGLVIYNTTTNKLNLFTTIWEAVTSL